MEYTLPHLCHTPHDLISYHVIQPHITSCALISPRCPPSHHSTSVGLVQPCPFSMSLQSRQPCACSRIPPRQWQWQLWDELVVLGGVSRPVHSRCAEPAAATAHQGRRQSLPRRCSCRHETEGSWTESGPRRTAADRAVTAAAAEGEEVFLRLNIKFRRQHLCLRLAGQRVARSCCQAPCEYRQRQFFQQTCQPRHEGTDAQ